MERWDVATSRVEEKRRFNSLVGFSSGGHDQSEGPSGALNLDRYNSRDGRMRLNAIYRIGI